MGDLWRIVQKKVKVGGKEYRAGDAIDLGQFKNASALDGSRFVRVPESSADMLKVRMAEKKNGGED